MAILRLSTSLHELDFAIESFCVDQSLKVNLWVHNAVHWEPFSGFVMFVKTLPVFE